MNHSAETCNKCLLVMKLLIIEDNPDLRETLKEIFEDENYSVDTAEDGEVGLYKATNWDYDCIICDVMMPVMDGFTVINKLRTSKDTPVLFLTAKDTTEDRVYGLDSGADDYVVKPFEIDEVLARVRSLIRRGHSSLSPILEHKNLSIDTNKKLISKNGEVVDLTAREYAFAELMLYQKGKIVTRDFLYEHLFDEDDESLSNLLDVYIYKVRKKLGKDFIKTKRGQGYIVD